MNNEIQPNSTAVSFINKINRMFPLRDNNGPFLEERPDFYLGRFLSMFADKVFMQDANFNVSSTPAKNKRESLFVPIFPQQNN